MEKFEDKLKQILLQYLRQEGAVGERFPICPDVEDKWKVLLESYLPDGVREFNVGWLRTASSVWARQLTV